MDRTKLYKAKSQSRSLVTPETYTELNPRTADKSIERADRKIDIEPLLSILDYGVKLFKDDGEVPEKTDGWFAPRIHAALRLFRSEAADIEYWDYLSIFEPAVREYVLWRWESDDNGLPTTNRIYGSLRRHSLGRLWWAAELTRNGPDYKTTEAAFDVGSQDFVNYITDVDAFHNRAAAVGFIVYLEKKRRNPDWKAKDSVDVGKTMNHILTTIVLDGLVPDDTSDLFAYEIWVNGENDETLMYEDLPVGPNDVKVSEEHINLIVDLLESLESD